MAKLFGANYDLQAYEAADIFPDGLHIDENVQRRIAPSRVKGIGQYIIRAVDTQTVGAFFAPLVVNKRTDGNMYILDGQHRYKGIGVAIDTLEKRVKSLSAYLSKKNLNEHDKDTAQSELAGTKRMLNSIRTSRIPVMVYQGLNTEEERQLFHDLNNLAKRAPTSLALLFDNSDPYVRVAKEVVSIVDGLEALVDHVNTNKLDEGKLFLFSTVHKSVVKLLGKRYFSDRGVQFTTVYNNGVEKTARFFEVVLASLPEDAATGNYLYKDAKVLQGIGEFVNKMDNIQYVDGLVTLRELLKDFSFQSTNKLFATAGGATRNPDGTISFKGTGSGIKAVVRTLSSQAIRYDANGIEATDAYKYSIDDKIDDSEVVTPDEPTVFPEAVSRKKSSRNSQSEKRRDKTPRAERLKNVEFVDSPVKAKIQVDDVEDAQQLDLTKQLSHFFKG
ncbi:DNA sulfur modification protein DndB [Alicyclobacillus ferrooxydans]|uniref:DGQHR domain-containing protein n=1 Tax=Alicyclobacillus ferrooxydans TaxID=471514 RepID=A0A0P9CXB0_9BACL|nr:DNA sulfur modification protein DndB [Alicyclobacillus ferrooxydans]KPV44394.1 hypothetical protein AN477_07130 [Alicyclobacillus ferrooxydans]